MTIHVSPGRVERVEQAVLAEEFREAAEAYADELLANLDYPTLERHGLRALMRKRERFTQARRMQLATPN